MDLPWTKTAGVDRNPLSWQGHHRQLYFDFWTPGSVLFGWNLTFDTMLGKRKQYESRLYFFSTPHMLGQSITNWGHNTLSVPKNELRVGHELRKNSEFPGTNYVQEQIYKRFVRSNGNIVLIIPKTLFEVRPINHLKTIYWTHRHFNRSYHSL